MTYYVSSGSLNPTHSLTHSLTRSEVIMLTNKHTHKQTDAAENIQCSSLRYATTLGKHLAPENTQLKTYNVLLQCK